MYVYKIWEATKVAEDYNPHKAEVEDTTRCL